MIKEIKKEDRFRCKVQRTPQTIEGKIYVCNQDGFIDLEANRFNTLDTEDYEIIEDGQTLGVITPIMGDNGITWSTHSDKIGDDYAQQIGELIEERDM